MNKKLKNKKEYIIKIPLYEFLESLKNYGILELLFQENTKFNCLQNKEYEKLFDRNEKIFIDFYEGINDDIPCEIDHITIKSSQKIIKSIIKKFKKNYQIKS